MKLLVLCTDYPTKNDQYKVAWAHARNKHYLKLGIDVSVLNFSCAEDYKIDNIKVFSKKSIENDFFDYDVILTHSPNLRMHYPFIFKERKKIKKLIIFFHGTESLYLNKDYPKPYSYNKCNKLLFIIRNLYDKLKLIYLKRLLRSKVNIRLIFVSKWMKRKAELNLGLKFDKSKSFTIHNCLSENFYHRKYKKNVNTNADFITIRKLDDSKYAIDLVLSFAKNHPEYTFDIYGKGHYFKYNKIPNNVNWIDSYIDQNDLQDILDKYKFAIMPTRIDAQGVMNCEMAVYGIPLLTSNIDVMNEMIGEFKNVSLLSEDDFLYKKNIILPDCSDNNINNLDFKFSKRNTLDREIEVFKNS